MAAGYFQIRNRHQDVTVETQILFIVTGQQAELICTILFKTKLPLFYIGRQIYPTQRIICIDDRLVAPLKYTQLGITVFFNSGISLVNLKQLTRLEKDKIPINHIAS